MIVRSAVSRFVSPLRYPGGKRQLTAFVAHLIGRQPKPPTRYIEPFAGGAGVALGLLIGEHVDEVLLNDLDRGVAAFWRAVFQRTDDLIGVIRSTATSIEEWHVQRDRYVTGCADDLELGFATFFLNRTNRSGIIGARPIGGLGQSGAWSMDARYNKEDLVGRIQRIARYRSRVMVCEEDGIDVARREVQNADTFVYADPPYLERGGELYLNALGWTDHARLAAYLRGASGWLVTYDSDPRVPGELYPGLRCAVFDISHTAARQHVGREHAVFSNSLHIESLIGLGRCASYVA